MQPRLASLGASVFASQMLRSQACLTTPGSQGFCTDSPNASTHSQLVVMHFHGVKFAQTTEQIGTA